MATFGSMPPEAGQKRGRGFSDATEPALSGHSGKKARPTLDSTGEPIPWHVDSVVNTPTIGSQKPKYDSDDQSSMMSEPGSPQYIGGAESSDDMDIDNDMEDVNLPPPVYRRPSSKPPPISASSPWRERTKGRDRVATPFTHSPATRPVARPLQISTTSPKHHVRSRHPQENMSDHLEVPSPIDEDEVPTPPSAAEAAGSQLSMLSVNDMEIEPTVPGIPSITIERSSEDRMMGNEVVGVRKQRARSGAQSNGSVSPVRLGTSMTDAGMGGVGKKGFSMGFRADCEKCRMKVPGHMNHFVL